MIDYKLLLEKLTELIDEGVQIVDENGTTVVYSSKMGELEKTKRKDVLGKPFREAFSGIPVEESTLLNALENNVATIDKPQVFFNKYGKSVNTVNTTVPVFKDGKIIAAIEVAKGSKTPIIDNKISEIRNLDKDDLSAGSDKMINTYTFRDLVGENKKFKKLVNEAKNIANNPSAVLIQGETGTGKELFAQSIHFASDRSDGPFLAQNCAALPENLLESILFGTVKGGFTGAVDRPGLFEQASGGTLLLDEISAMPYNLQSKLLRTLQENYVRRVGGENDIPINVRIIATSNESLEELIETSRFRKDLYYRLNIITLNLIPIRERKDDIILLANEFIKKHSEKLGKKVVKISKSAERKLLSYDYYGNVRELENIIIAAMSFMDDETVMSSKHIRFLEQANTKENSNHVYSGSDSLSERVKRFENNIIEDAMKRNGSNVTKAAEDLGIKRQTLQYKLKKINKEE